MKVKMWLLSIFALTVGYTLGTNGLLKDDVQLESKPQASELSKELDRSIVLTREIREDMDAIKDIMIERLSHEDIEDIIRN